MKSTHAIAIGLLSLSAACSAFAQDQVFTATLLGSNESPANNSAGTGLATVTLDPQQFSMHVQASFSGLSGTATMAHIHCCTAQPNMGTAGVAFGFPSFPTGITAGTYDNTFDLSQAGNWNATFFNAHGGTIGTAFTALGKVLGNGTAYVNIHSTAFPGGELRGNLTAAVPEPETSALALVGLLSLAGMCQRRKAKASSNRQAAAAS